MAINRNFKAASANAKTKLQRNIAKRSKRKIPELPKCKVKSQRQTEKGCKKDRNRSSCGRHGTSIGAKGCCFSFVCTCVCVVLNSTQAHLPFLSSLSRTTLQADFSWSIKAENETVESLGSGDKKAYEDKSYYILQEDYAIARTYRCVANNTAGPGAFCEIEVAGECKDAFKNIRRE